MTDRPLLVVLGSAVTALAVARDAWRAGLDAVLLDRVRGVACSTRRARSEVLEAADDDAVIARVRELSQIRPGSALVATSDGWVRFVRRHRSALAARFDRILHPSDAVLDLCLDKVVFASWCRAHGFPAPDSYAGTNADLARVRLPAILRPSQTLHDAPHLGLPKAVEVTSEPELRAWLDRFDRANVVPVLSESLLARPLVQLSVPIVRAGGTTLAFVARKIRPGPARCAAGTYVEAWPDEAAETLARRLVETLAFEGIGELEVLRDEQTGEDFVVELNPRPWSQFAMAGRLGLDFLGTALARPCPRARRRAAWLDFTNDAYAVLSRSEGMIARGEIGWGGYLRSLLGAGVGATFDLRDPGPFLADLKTFLHRWCRR